MSPTNVMNSKLVLRRSLHLPGRSERAKTLQGRSHAAVLLLEIPETSIESLDECKVSRWTSSTSLQAPYPRIPWKRLRTREETPRKQGDTMCIIVFDVYCRPVFLEPLLVFGVSSGELRDIHVSKILLNNMLSGGCLFESSRLSRA